MGEISGIDWRGAIGGKVELRPEMGGTCSVEASGAFGGKARSRPEMGGVSGMRAIGAIDAKPEANDANDTSCASGEKSEVIGASGAQKRE